MPRPTTTDHQPKYVHHHPSPPTTSQNMSTTIHHQSKYIHHHPAPAKIYPPLPTISQKMDRHPAKAKIYSYITSFRHCFNSSFFFEIPFRDGGFVWLSFDLFVFQISSFYYIQYILRYLRFPKFYVSRV